MFIEQDVVAVEVAVDDRLVECVQVVHALGHIQRNGQLGVDIYQPETHPNTNSKPPVHAYTQ